MQFNEILEMVEELTLDEKSEINRIITNRIRDEKRDILAKEIAEAEAEYNEGKLKSQSVDEILKDLTNDL